jgi:predicted dehydrogenase
MASGHINDLTLRLFGTNGGLEVRFANNQSLLRGCLGKNMPDGHWEDIDTPAVKSNYVRFIEAIRASDQVAPDFARGASLQRVLDAAVRSDAEMSRDVAV